jgi:TRAP-type mannitol/chloroaromatic compound transport system permease small subunit
MSDVSMNAAIIREGEPAPLTRLFGWGMLAFLAAYLINNTLVVWFGFPGAGSAFSGGGTLAIVQAAIYALSFALAAVKVFGSPNAALRFEAERISAFNGWVVRSCFWAVLFVGIADAAIAFMRTENLLINFMSQELVLQFNLSRFVGPYIHTPLVVLGLVVGLFTRTLGFTWLALMIVAAELLIVISRFVFSYEQALMGDLVRYWYAALFLFASAYTLMDEGHVRVDVFYAGMNPRGKGRVNALGSIFLGMTTCWVIIVIGMAGKTAIINSPIVNFEVTQTGGTGMFIKYHMAAFLGIFAITMVIQFVSYLFEAAADMRGEPGKREVAPIAH